MLRRKCHLTVTYRSLERSTRAGESWHRGPVVLSWADVLRGAANIGDGYNVVLHEFAHKLDEENNGTNGQPVLYEQGQYGEWADCPGARSMSRSRSALPEERTKCCMSMVLHHRLSSSLSQRSRFFEKAGRDAERRLPQLYDQLRRFYHLHPATWGRSRS